MTDRVDFVVFGATGFTGQFVVEEVARLAEEKNLRWGVSGRNKDKLISLLKQQGGKLGKDFSEIPIFVADVNNSKSLEAMASCASVVLNCCGPFRNWGEQVVRACISAGAHHLDVSGEPQYMEQMQLKYNAAASQKGVYIISGCGASGIPNDMGLIFLQEQFEGNLNSVVSYLTLMVKDRGSGAVLHYGTYESAVHSAFHRNELGALRRELFPNKLPEMLPVLKPRKKLFKSEHVNMWCVPLLAADRSVMYRSQRILYETEKKRPARIETFFTLPSLSAAGSIIAFGGLFMLISKYSLGQKMLMRHPKFFTKGYASHEGPTEETMKNTLFVVTLVGEGWEENVEDPITGYDTPPSKRVTVEVKGVNIAYAATATMLVTAAYILLKEVHKIPGNGGVLPPGAAFAKSSLISELQKRGISFDIVTQEKI